MHVKFEERLIYSRKCFKAKKGKKYKNTLKIEKNALKIEKNALKIGKMRKKCAKMRKMAKTEKMRKNAQKCAAHFPPPAFWVGVPAPSRHTPRGGRFWPPCPPGPRQKWAFLSFRCLRRRGGAIAQPRKKPTPRGGSVWVGWGACP